MVVLLWSPFATVSDAGTFVFPVQSEQAITGTTTGLVAAQSDDGVLEGLFEADTAPDATTAPSTQVVTTGIHASGAFPGDVSSLDGAFVRYREADEAETWYRSNTGSNTVNSPKTRAWDGSSWSAETEQSTASSPIRLVRMAWSPVSSTTRIVVTLSDDGWIDAYVCTPTCTVTSNIGQVWSAAPGQPQKRADIAYEQVSGDALLVYGVLSNDTTRDIAYRTFVGGSWSAEQYLDDTGQATDIQYSLVRLASKRGTNDIGLIGGDDTNDDANAWIWDGSAWGSNTEIAAAAENPQREQADIAWESSSGHLLAVAVDRNSPENIVSKEYTTSWSAAATFQCAAVGDNIRWLSLRANPLPTADDMVIAAGDNANSVHTCYWTGSAWANLNTHDTGIDATGTRAFDFAWESAGSVGLLVWGTTAAQITYRTFAAPNTWGAITNVAMGTNVHAWISLLTNPSPQAGDSRILGVVMETTANDLGGIRWDGTTFAVMSASTFTADTGSTAYDSFDLEYQATNDNQLLVRYDWTGVPAGDSNTVQINGYRVDENVDVEVLTPPATWNPRITITSTTSTLYSFDLTSSEYASGSPAIRFVDASGPDGAPSDLFLDRVVVTTVNLEYSLEVRQNITGIIAFSSATLVVKGNISSGGENFDIHIWNYTAAAWELLLSSPFTSADSYYNQTLAAGHISSGSVQVRFVDFGAQDGTRWALGLDFVAVSVENVAASLTGGGSIPTIGNITTSFAFFVRYSDPESDGPAFVDLILDGVPYAMLENNTGDTDFADGKEYYLNLAIGVRGVFNFTFSARAATGDLAPASTIVRQVTVSNRAPILSNPISADSVHAGRSYIRDFIATDPDNDTLSWSLSTNATWLSIGPSNGTVWGMSALSVGSFYVNATTSDGFDGSAGVNYTLFIDNTRPLIAATGAALISFRRSPVVYDLNASDPEGDPLAWSLRSNASFLSIGPVNGTVFGVAASVPSSYWFEATVSDGRGGEDRRNLTLLVVNRPPQMSISASSTGTSGDPYSGQFSASDPDDDALTWSLSTNATWLSLDAASGTLTGTPLAGVYYVNLTVRDPYGGSAFTNFTITVDARSTPPLPDNPSGLRSELWTFSLITLLFGILVAIVVPRRRPVVESAFLLDQAGRVRFEFAFPGTVYDEVRLRSTLRGVNWRGQERVHDPPFTLYVRPDSRGDWIFVSRTSDADRVTKSAEKLIAKMLGGVKPPQAPASE